MLAVDPDHLCDAKQWTQSDVEADLLMNFPDDRRLDGFEKIDLAAGQVPVAGLRRRATLDQQDAPIAQYRRAAADAGSLTQEARAARIRAQERAPLWNEEISYFSFGEWALSSSSAKPTRSASMFSSRLKAPTIGIDPPVPIKSAGLPHSPSSARRARRKASLLVATTIAGLEAWPMNSALTSAGKRAFTKLRKLCEILSGFCRPTSRKETFARASAGSTVLEPSPVKPPTIPLNSQVGRDHSISSTLRPFSPAGTESPTSPKNSSSLKLSSRHCVAISSGNSSTPS